MSKRRIDKYNINFSLSLVSEQFADVQEQYLLFHHHFWNNSPAWLKRHRLYFKSKQRGFGDDAFHVMWYILINDLRPKNLLEIGVYRGQVISLWSLIMKNLSINASVHGITPLVNAADAVSAYVDIDYLEDIKKNFSHFMLDLPNIHKGYSTDLAMIDVIQSRKWDIIYINGSHDYAVVKNDFEICSNCLSQNSIIVLDDSALYTTFKPPVYASAGHPGPSRVANEIDGSKFKEIISVGHNRVFQRIAAR